jgi:outer membrane protein OmpA-like peptidoglycan-associated protein
VASQERTLTTLAKDFKRYLEFKPEAYLTLRGHADVRGSAEFNKALSERRVERTKSFLVEQGVPEAKIETLGFGSQENLTAAQVKELAEKDTELSDAEREKVLRDLDVIVWAQNRRVDINLSTTG